MLRFRTTRFGGFFVTQRIAALLLFSLVVAFAQERTAADFIRDGNLNLARGDCSFAQYFFQEALKLEPNNVEAAIGKGRALVCQRAYALGIEELQRALSLAPNNVSAHIHLARAYQEQFQSDPTRFSGRLSDALGIIQNAERLDPNNPEVLNTKGVVLFLIGDLAGARDALERAVTLSAASQTLSNPDKATINVNLGRTYRELGELELALRAFRRAVALNPLSAVAHNNVGDIHFRMGNCDDAIYELTQAVHLNSTLLDAVANLAIALFECGEVEASIPRFEQALDLPGVLNIPPVYTYLSRAFVKQGRYDEAVTRAQQGALLPPASAEAFYHLGRAYEARNAQGDAQRAREAYQSALEIDPNFTPAREALSRLQ